MSYKQQQGVSGGTAKCSRTWSHHLFIQEGVKKKKKNTCGGFRNKPIGVMTNATLLGF